MFPDVRSDSTVLGTLPPLLSVEEVRERYRLRSAQAARRVMRQAGARSVAGRLFVPVSELAAWEATRAIPVAREHRPLRKGAQRRVKLDLSDLEAGWWRQVTK